jgi:hypothetical protein
MASTSRTVPSATTRITIFFINVNTLATSRKLQASRALLGLRPPEMAAGYCRYTLNKDGVRDKVRKWRR